MVSWASWASGRATRAKREGSSIHALSDRLRVTLGLTATLDIRLGALVAFAVVYGFVFINYIDMATSGVNYGYHVWLAIMYFLPFVGFSMFNLKNLKLTIGLGLIASLMNDVFYGFTEYLTKPPFDLTRYYNLWLIPHGNLLFNFNLGFASVPVYSWVMALSIYVRIAVVAVLLWSWKQGQNR